MCQVTLLGPTPVLNGFFKRKWPTHIACRYRPYARHRAVLPLSGCLHKGRVLNAASLPTKACTLRLLSRTQTQYRNPAKPLNPVACCSHNAQPRAALPTAPRHQEAPLPNPSHKVAAVVHSVPGAKHVPTAAAQEARVRVDHEGVVWCHAVRTDGQDLHHARL